MIEREKTDLYAIFHLNLAYSSIEVDQHIDVINRCYWPLLRLCDDLSIPLGIELTGQTLRRIERLDPDWINTFRQLIKANKCELLASGDQQIIGPLVPSEVNKYNISLGLEEYQRIFDVCPSIAYINEQAVSVGLLDVYIDHGFTAVVVEWDNPFSHNEGWSEQTLFAPQTLVAASGRHIKVIWNHAVAFQKLQRLTHGEIPAEDYMDYLNMQCRGAKCFPVYGNDAEVFDFRPARYQSEVRVALKEWDRLRGIINNISSLAHFRWSLPSECLRHWQPIEPLQLTNAAFPISVKKQAKYNITRWGLSGRNDLLLNTLCFQGYRQLQSVEKTSSDDWKKLVESWSSDFRTHLTEKRYNAINQQWQQTSTPTESPKKIDQHYQYSEDQSRHILQIQTADIHLSLSTYRGLSIHSLAFKKQDFIPICGTIPHGYFNHIGLAADFYSNHMVAEHFVKRQRIADLNQCDYVIESGESGLHISTDISTPLGLLKKRYTICGATLCCDFVFDDDTRPECSLRLGYITLLDTCQRPWFSCHNGGYEKEKFFVKDNIDHGAPVSSIVSSSCALGATEGEFLFGTNDLALRLSWEPDRCAALPMVSSQKSFDQYLNRMWFSMVESDETMREGGRLPSFSYRIEAI